MFQQSAIVGSLPWRTKLSYGVLGMPLAAIAALTYFVYLPKFTSKYNLSRQEHMSIREQINSRVGGRSE